MRAATMFSGIGAPEVAMPEWDWRWCAEIDKFPSAVHAKRHKSVPNLGDVNQEDFIERAKYEGPIDVLIFGSPCQSFSVAGKRLGLNDPRGNLALISLKIARQLRPRWLVFENVPGLLSSDSGRDFGTFLRVMEECGYYGAWRILDAQYFGVPQRRRRIFFIGYLGDWRPPAAVFFERESLRGDTSPSRKSGQNVAPTISARTKGGGGLGSDFEIDGGLIPEVSPALQARDYKGVGSDGVGQGAPLIPKAINLRGREGGVMPTVADAYAVRRLTPKECERLQGFPDDFTRIAWRGKEERKCPDGPRYKSLGNSMAVPVMRWLLTRLYQVNEITETT